MTFNQRIKYLRELRGLSQNKLAALTGYKERSSIAKIETGVTEISINKVNDFCTALQVNPLQLLGLQPLPGESGSSYDQSNIYCLSQCEKAIVEYYRQASPIEKEMLERMCKVT